MTEFSELVWGLTKRVPKGKVTTYGEIARALGKPAASRAVGQALRNNPNPIAVPCHRVVRSDGSLGGYCGRAASLEKARLLKREGVLFKKNRIDMKERTHRF